MQSRETFLLAAEHGDCETVKKFVDAHQFDKDAVKDIIEAYRLAERNKQEKSISILSGTFAVQVYLIVQGKRIEENKVKANNLFASRTFSENDLRLSSRYTPRSKL